MFDKWLNLPAHYYLHLTALSLLMVGLPLSNVVMSIGTIWIIANWLIEGDFKSKWERFKANKPLIAISVLFIWLFISFAWSSDLQYASKDLVNKLPFIVIPLVVGTREHIKQKNYTFLLYLFIASLTVTTLINYFHYKNSQHTDIRQMSMFISHIRLGMLLCLGIFLAFYEVIKKRINAFIVVPVLIWLLYYLYLSQVLIAYLIFAALLYVSIVYFIKSKKIKLGVVFSTIILILIFVFKANQTIKSFHQPININFDTLDVYTANGNKYLHHSNFNLKENGKLVWIYVCEKELRREWYKKSEKPFDENEQEVFGTLIRYMTSKDLRKDSLGFSKLTNEDIKKIERGVTNSNQGISSKLHKVYIDLYTLTASGDPNGHSFYQRVEHFKTGMHILFNNWLFGVGVGDVQLAFDEQYKLDHSKLNADNRHRAHNQILTLWLSIGLVGFLLIIYILFYPLFTKPITYPLLITTITLIIGFLTQDLIESQAGVTLFALFYSLTVLSKPKKT
jgi:putative effector of murein hydrolase LrgA (UPF0299 family)